MLRPCSSLHQSAGVRWRRWRWSRLLAVTLLKLSFGFCDVSICLHYPLQGAVFVRSRGRDLYPALLVVVARVGRYFLAQFNICSVLSRYAVLPPPCIYAMIAMSELCPSWPWCPWLLGSDELEMLFSQLGSVICNTPNFGPLDASKAVGDAINIQKLTSPGEAFPFPVRFEL